MSEVLRLIPVDALTPDPNQPRRSQPPPEVLERMAASLKARGMLNPIRVVPYAGGWRVVTGECRWRAARLAGLIEVPCLVAEVPPTEEAILTDQLTENIVREELPPLELAEAIAKLKALKGCTAQHLAAELGLSGGGVTRAEALLSLPESVQTLVREGRLAPLAAYQISRLPDVPSQLMLAEAFAAGRLNCAQVADAVKDRVGQKRGRPGKARLTLRLEGGMSMTVSAAEDALTWERLLASLDALRKEAKSLRDSGQEVSALAKAFAVS
jgi:ParB family chromosome partitioning protein